MEKRVDIFTCVFRLMQKYFKLTRGDLKMSIFGHNLADI